MQPKTTNPLLAEALAKRKREWGALNATWLSVQPEYVHGCPALKRHGHPPIGAGSARPKPNTYHAAEWSHAYKHMKTNELDKRK